jgi:hypothetical protein
MTLEKVSSRTAVGGSGRVGMMGFAHFFGLEMAGFVSSTPSVVLIGTAVKVGSGGVSSSFVVCVVALSPLSRENRPISPKTLEEKKFVGRLDVFTGGRSLALKWR